MPSDKQPGNEPQKKKDSLEEKIHRHLNDKNDHISDEDIRDVVVGSNTDQSPTDDGRSIAEKAAELRKRIGKDKPGSAWDNLADG
ncbi:MAG: hypothetical protein EOO09_10825 [Chitinophagaceae bacterium]|nr:MAG: hypothetical protein EOO09_10825 [Chitinophagaceae bacterium]